MTKRTALTGFIVPKCKVYGDGFFSKEALDPDNFGNEISELRKNLKDVKIDLRKSEISELKNEKLKRFEKKDFEMRNGRIVIHRRYNILKNKDDNLIVIGARNKPYLDYRRTYKNEKGQRLTEEGRYLIKRRIPHVIKNGLFKISKSPISPKNPYIKIHRKRN